MVKKCFICTHKNRCQIDELILQKTPYNTIAKKFKIGGKDPVNTIKSHVRNGHIPKAIQAAQHASDVKDGLNLQTCAQEIYDICIRGAKKAETEDLRALGSCISPAVKVLELLNKSDGDKSGDLPKESGFVSGYMKRAGEIYAKGP